MELEISYRVEVPAEVFAQLGPDDGSEEWEEASHHLAMAWANEDTYAALDHALGQPDVSIL